MGSVGAAEDVVFAAMARGGAVEDDSVAAGRGTMRAGLDGADGAIMGRGSTTVWG